MAQSVEPHSAQYLSSLQRAFWWNQDFLELIARRYSLCDVKLALDVGAGKGHWSRALLSVLSSDSRMIGIEREHRWVDEAQSLSRALHVDNRLEFKQGSAESLPFANDTFDLVTCQTLLLHVPDVVQVLFEMRRVLKPGGRILVVEPVNLASSSMLGSSRHLEDVDTLSTLFRFELTCYRGKQALGEGDNSVGSMIPHYMWQVGFRDMSAYQSDKASLLLPPYADDEGRATVTDMETSVADSLWIWDRETTFRYFTAGGGVGAQFEHLWSFALASMKRTLAGINRHSEFSVGSGVVYIISATK